MTDKEKKSKIADILLEFYEEYQCNIPNRPMIPSLYASKIIDSMQEEPEKCMYAQPNYTNGDRLVLCKDCNELCKYNQKTAAESLGISQEVYDKIVDECIYGMED